MSKTYKLVFGLMLLLVISLAWLESSEQDPVNWNPSYTKKDNIALGARVFYESWKSAEDDSIQNIKIPPYEYLNTKPENGTYFFLNNHVSFDDDELEDILEWVSKGNTLFMSSYGFGENLEDTLNIELTSSINFKGFTSRPEVNFSNPALQFEKDLEFDQDLPAVSFEKIDTLNHTVLGYSSFNEKTKDKRINFIKTKFGKGEIYLHSVPQLFSNYFLLQDKNYQYAERLLAYMPENRVLWDAYYKSGKSFFTSPLYILMNNRPLKWAYYFVLITAILFILFEGKRKQRTIPVIEPLKNKSYEFTETISSLYIEQNRFHELGLKKITLFMEFIRTNYRLNTQKIDEEFYRSLASKTDNTVEETKHLFQKMERFQDQRKDSKNEFYELSKNINLFKRQNGKSGYK